VKNRLVPVAVGVAILGCVLAVSANVTTSKIHQNLLEERYQRLETERALQQAVGKIESLDVQLNDYYQRLSGIQEILTQGTSTTNSMKDQLENVRQENETLKSEVKALQDKSEVKAFQDKVEGAGVPASQDAGE
jgi:peptidoglycan hydrolase CwlO-like protein